MHDFLLNIWEQTLGASRLYTLLHVQIRSALPGILTGMRICVAGAGPGQLRPSNAPAS